MSVMSVRIDDMKKKELKLIAAIQGKTMGGIISALIDQYIQTNKQELKNLSEYNNLQNIMKMSESSFMEWDNKEDEIYNEL